MRILRARGASARRRHPRHAAERCAHGARRRRVAAPAALLQPASAPRRLCAARICARRAGGQPHDQRRVALKMNRARAVPPTADFPSPPCPVSRGRGGQRVPTRGAERAGRHAALVRAPALHGAEASTFAHCTACAACAARAASARARGARSCQRCGRRVRVRAARAAARGGGAGVCMPFAGAVSPAWCAHWARTGRAAASAVPAAPEPPRRRAAAAAAPWWQFWRRRTAATPVAALPPAPPPAPPRPNADRELQVVKLSQARWEEQEVRGVGVVGLAPACAHTPRRLPGCLRGIAQARLRVVSEAYRTADLAKLCGDYETAACVPRSAARCVCTATLRT